ncbi:glycosyl hydrolase [Bifidobacterium mongoliense]|jgi:mannan endo-1,4-beta-mannosidase|uniref:glycosyl hydrolase n=1 Tax=Bifidobacterium mongoliense TaxID=518643 RepID=UPI0030EE2D20
MMIQSNRVRIISAIVSMAALACLSVVPVTAEGAEAAPVAIADSHASAATTALFQKLRDGNDTIKFGQQHATDYHVTPTPGETSDVHDVTGKYPAVFGFDALSITGDELPGRKDASEESNVAAVAGAMKDADAKGAVVTMTAHWNNFLPDGGNYGDTRRVVDRLMPGRDLNSKFTHALDRIAQVAQQSVRSDGTQIPIIFRPLHENNGTFFWWGATHASASEYIELFRYIVNYLRDVKGVHNLLYAYSPGGSFGGDSTQYLSTYPGDQWVDLLGYDYYYSSNNPDTATWISSAVTDLAMVSKLAASKGKLSAFTEFGLNSNAKINSSGNSVAPTFFTDLYDAIAKNEDARKIAYMLTWSDFGGEGSNFQAYVPWKGTPMAEDFQRFASQKTIEFASGQPQDYRSDIQAVAYPGSVRFVTPATQLRIEDGQYLVVAKVEGDAKVTNTWFTVGDEGTAHKMQCGDFGFCKAEWSISPALLNGAPVAMTLHAQTSSTVLTSTIEVILGKKPEQPAGTIDTFDSYANNDELRNVYSPANASADVMSLVPNNGGNALQFSYDFIKNPQYNGISRSYSPAQDWSGFDHLALEVVSDGSDHKLVIQIKAGGVTFEAYPSLRDAGAKTVNIDPSDFAPASWDTANKGKVLNQERLKSVSSFAVYVNDGDNEYGKGAESRNPVGHVILDSIAWERSVVSCPVVVENFEDYSSTRQLGNVWKAEEGGEASLGASEVQGVKSLTMSAQSADGKLQVSRSLIGQNWSGQEGIRLRVDPRKDLDSPVLHVGLTAYRNGVMKEYSYIANVVPGKWQILFIPFSSASSDTNGKAMARANGAEVVAGPSSLELAAVQRLSLSLTADHVTGNSVVAVDDIRADRESDYPVQGADRDTLRHVVEKADSRNSQDYRPDTWKAMDGIRRRSHIVLEDRYALGTDMVVQTQALERALANLVPVSAPSPEGTSGTNQKGEHSTQAVAPASKQAPRRVLAATGWPIAGLVIVGLVLIVAGVAVERVLRERADDGHSR